MADRVFVALALAAAASCAGASAGFPQAITTRTRPADSVVTTGARVRVSIASARRQWPWEARVEQLRGTVHAVAHDTLYLLVPNVARSLAIPRSAVRRLELSAGASHGRSELRAGAIGAFLFGLRMWVVSADPKTRRFPHPWQGAAVGGALGFAAGAWLARRSTAEGWRAVHLPRDTM